MKTPASENRTLDAVHLLIRKQGERIAIECELCHTIIVSGELKVLQISQEELIRRAAAEHVHKWQ